MIWEDLWLPTLPARPARHIATVVHPMMPFGRYLLDAIIGHDIIEMNIAEAIKERNPSSKEFSSEKRPSDDIVPNDSKVRVLVHESRTQAVRTIL
ncbi:hypothetical protein F2Q69_00036702 [Brassica cretica]|uniref:Uncharacterized protein n=1 Tax=Brassica cretica TaxID=69181 RepID=A0A8S9SV61_BRACR|nr:hypothetical protein F2Q69_00036702 [Brassica cretica]